MINLRDILIIAAVSLAFMVPGERFIDSVVEKFS
jgi:hypothetical protein